MPGQLARPRLPLVFVAVLLAAIAAYTWFFLGPLYGRPVTRDQWEALIRERIKVPEGYQLEIFARDLGQPRLMQMAASGDLIVSAMRDGTLLMVKADSDGDGRSDGTVTLRDTMNNPHGLVLEGSTLLVA